MSVRDTSREAYHKPGHAHARKQYAARMVTYVRQNPRSSRYDVRDDLSIPLESVCSAANDLVKKKVLMDWRTAINPRTGNKVTVLEIYDENDLAPEQPGLFHGEHDLT